MNQVSSGLLGGGTGSARHAAGAARRLSAVSWPDLEPQFTARAHFHGILALVFHPTLPLLASAEDAGDLLEWDFRAADHLLDLGSGREH